MCAGRTCGPCRVHMATFGLFNCMSMQKRIKNKTEKQGRKRRENEITKRTEEKERTKKKEGRYELRGDSDSDRQQTDRRRTGSV